MGNIVLSPSNMQTFRDCPLRFYGSSVIRDIPWKASTSKARGMAVHNNLEKCLRLGWQHGISWDDQINTYFAKERVDAVQNLRRSSDLFIEHEMAINHATCKCDWWAEDALLRAKADAILVPKKNYPFDYRPRIDIIDIKTGKKWDEDDFQLRVEALLAHIIYKYDLVHYEYWYVDTAETSIGTIDFSQGLAPVQDILDLMHDMLLSIKQNNFVRHPNRFCRWCAYYKTEKCR